MWESQRNEDAHVCLFYTDKQAGLWIKLISILISSRKTLLLLRLKVRHYFFLTFFHCRWPDVSFSSPSSAHTCPAPSLNRLQSPSNVLIHGFLSSHGLILEKQPTQPSWEEAIRSTYAFIFQIRLWPHAAIFQSNQCMFLQSNLSSCAG